MPQNDMHEEQGRKMELPFTSHAEHTYQFKRKRKSPKRTCYSPKDLVGLMLKRLTMLSRIYPLRAFSDNQRPCKEIRRSGTPLLAAVEAPPDLRECKQTV